jgi:50S ribosomal protein L16 3-hydroxylase
VFDPPRRLSAGKFRERCAKQGVRLALKSQMLYRGDRVFINGEKVRASGEGKRLLAELADRRRLPPSADLPDDMAALLHQWASAGWVE